jgi:glycerol-3-phosphate dehydrogenase (NAD(P)+)
MEKVSIIGDGGWGTTLAILLVQKGCDVRLWSYSKEYAEFLRNKRENTKFLPGIKIPAEIFISSGLNEVTDKATITILAVPSQYMRQVVTRLKGIDLNQSIIVSVAKGIENDTLLRMSEVIKEILGNVRLVVLSGPSIAYEVARQVPTTVVAASAEQTAGEKIQGILSSERFRVYTSSDVTGVELGGALKNIIAIAAGISDGLGFGTNTKAALLTRGLVEITRLGVALGADANTFRGLSGMGDLVTTCISPQGRNLWLGREIGKGRPLNEVLKDTEMVVEGVPTTKSTYQLSKTYKVDMPITREIYSVLFENKDPKSAVRDLMLRDPKPEE